MQEPDVGREVVDFLVYLIELAAQKIFDGDRVKAFEQLSSARILDYYAQTYDVSHTLGSSYLVDEIKGLFEQKEALKC